MNKPASLRVLFHEFLNAVNGINVETQTFPLTVQLRSLEKAMENEKRSIKEKIKSILKVAYKEHDRACSILKSVQAILDMSEVDSHKSFMRDITVNLQAIKDRLDNVDIKTKNMLDEGGVRAVLQDLLALQPDLQSLGLVFRHLKSELTSKGVYHSL